MEVKLNDIKWVGEAIRDFQKYDQPLVGKNDEGEDVITEVTEDCIITVTFQSNGWICKNYYYADGYVEEMYSRC